VKPIAISLLIFIIYGSCLAQNNDSVVFKIERVKKEKSFNLVSVRIGNFSRKPIAILHTASIFLWQDPPALLITFKRDSTNDYFSLNFAGRDSNYSEMIENWNLNAQLILPLQHFSFDIIIPVTAQQQQLKVDYIKLDDLHYNDFEQRIYQNAATWYETYKKRTKWLMVLSPSGATGG